MDVDQPTPVHEMRSNPLNALLPLSLKTLENIIENNPHTDLVQTVELLSGVVLQAMIAPLCPNQC